MHAAAGYWSIAVLRRGRLILFRHRPAGKGDDDLVDLVHQTTMYYEDRLGGRGYDRVLLAAAMDGATAADAAHVRRLLETHLDTVVTPIAVNRSAELSDPGGLLPAVVAAPAGLLVREQTPDVVA